MTYMLTSDDKDAKSLDFHASVTWREYKVTHHQFLAAICPEEEGGYSAYALHLPGVVSQGETIEEAEGNIKEAFLAMLEARRNRGQPLQYSQRPIIDVPEQCHKVWVSIDA